MLAGQQSNDIRFDRGECNIWIYCADELTRAGVKSDLAASFWEDRNPTFINAMTLPPVDLIKKLFPEFGPATHVAILRQVKCAFSGHFIRRLDIYEVSED